MAEIDKIIKEFQPEKNHGFIPDKIFADQYILGAEAHLDLDVLQLNGDWSEFIPQVEIQRNEYIETYNCTSFGTLNALEFLFKRLYGEEKNWSERYVGIAAGTRPPGNSPHKVIQTIRNESGLIDEAVLPLKGIKTIEEYYSPDPLPWLMQENGKKFLEEYQIGHEWVVTAGGQNQDKLMEALMSSPLGCSVNAWIEKDGLYVKPTGSQDNHWCVIYGYKENEYWNIYDSYDSTSKKLVWNYDFYQVKRYSITPVKKKTTCWQRFCKKYKINLFQ